MNEEEFDRIVYKHQGIIWKVCRTFFRDKEDQKDLFQDILLRLWKGSALFQNKSKITTWIYRVSLNQAIDKSRKVKLKTTALSTTISAQIAEQHKNSNTEYDIEALYLAIARLIPLEKALIVLYLEQMPYKEISEIIGLSEKNVSVKLVRIKEKLKVHYEQITKVN